MLFINIFSVLLIVTGCSMHSSTEKYHALLSSPSEECIRVLHQKIRKITDIEDLDLSKDLFSRSNLLVLSNHPRSPFRFNDPMTGVKGSEKLLRLYQKNDICYVALVDENGNVIKKETLYACHCKRKEVD